jgi:tetrahydromethanopterin S-methyltransferase subunit C
MVFQSGLPPFDPQTEVGTWLALNDTQALVAGGNTVTSSASYTLGTSVEWRSGGETENRRIYDFF